MTLIVAIRIKGTVNVSERVDRTLRLLHLRRKFNATILRDDPVTRGMLQRAKDYIVWQEIPVEKAAELLQKWGRTTGWRPLTLEYLRSKGINSYEELLKLYEDRKVKFRELGIKPYVGLPPPKRGIPRRKYTALELLERMMQNGN